MPWFYEKTDCIVKEKMLELAEQFVEKAKQVFCKNPKKVLLLPPDITRAHSGAGWITEAIYNIVSKDADVHVIPTLGQHVPHTEEQNRWMFGSIPQEKIHDHDWKDGSKIIGEIPAEFVKEVSDGKADWKIPVSLNKMLLEEDWGLILNIGHVVPHEVLGFANHNKNYFIGLGGKDMICASHMMAACCGIENNLGKLLTPLRKCFNYTEEHFLSHLNDAYFQVVMAYNSEGKLVHNGVYAGDDLDTYLEAAKHSRDCNIETVPPLKKVVAVMQGDEFYSTWVANKAVYRTRMAIADGGELLIIAPGLKRFGEQPEVDAIIRKYGYTGTENIMNKWRDMSDNHELREFAHGTAHLLHGSSEGRFTITYAPGNLTEKDIKSVNFNYANIDEVLKKYDIEKLNNGFNTMTDDEEIYFISTPSAGLWSTEEKLNNS